MSCGPAEALRRSGRASARRGQRAVGGAGQDALGWEGIGVGRWRGCARARVVAHIVGLVAVAKARAEFVSHIVSACRCGRSVAPREGSRLERVRSVCLTGAPADLWAISCRGPRAAPPRPRLGPISALDISPRQLGSITSIEHWNGLRDRASMRANQSEPHVVVALSLTSLRPTIHRRQ